MESENRAQHFVYHHASDKMVGQQLLDFRILLIQKDIHTSLHQLYRSSHHEVSHCIFCVQAHAENLVPCISSSKAEATATVACNEINVT